MRAARLFCVSLSLLCALNFGSAQADTTDGDTGDTYPHVTKLETYILGQTHVNDALQVRLARMEDKAFGKASTNPDLSARTDALTDYADQKLGKKTPVATDDMYQTTDDSQADSPVAPAPPATADPVVNSALDRALNPTAAANSPLDSTLDSTTNSSPTDSDGMVGNYPHITELETEILRQTYPQDELPARLARMEAKAFGTPSTNSDLSSRTDALDTYAEKTLHKKSFDKQQAEQAASQGYTTTAAGGAGGGGGSKSKEVLKFLGNQLLSMAVPIPGIGMVGGIPTLGSNNNSSQDEHASAPPPEDPAIFAPTPPPQNARMSTQVGWCEMRIFKHTSPQLHLVQRLEQLNTELNYAPNQKGIDLMDDVPKLIQAVASREPSRPQASVAQPTH